MTPASADFRYRCAAVVVERPSLKAAGVAGEEDIEQAVRERAAS